MTIIDLTPGEVGTINGIKGDRHLQNRLVELGLLPGTEVRLVKCTPFNGPVEIKVRDSYLSIRRDDAKLVELK
ncbi:MAG: ferrous iron transport protein A [Candidatus Marinimicrobia bacterium]|nr:ferrous iron transport protein A [Candidatus Neomarinimicrobiota bacterium]MBL7010135.1 ferrous iron transport protein A [Candidatus Neomarinimicrobiota bacterium]MBL7030400.1 ferrous iron transport protein A [Candidatus Neomarinimicrobiota bacterium]